MATSVTEKKSFEVALIIKSRNSDVGCRILDIGSTVSPSDEGWHFQVSALPYVLTFIELMLNFFFSCLSS